MKIAITGSSGLIGNALIEKLTKKGNEILEITRGNHEIEDVMWDPKNNWIKEDIFIDVDVVINLSGHTIGGRLTKNAKKHLDGEPKDLSDCLQLKVLPKSISIISKN